MKNNFYNNFKAAVANRIILLAISLFSFLSPCLGQVNFVINGGFDYVNNCSDPYPGWISFAPPWDTLKNGGGYGDVMNKCYAPSTNVGIPYNLSGGGYQEPRSGNGYAYIVYFKLTPNPAVNWRWYIQQKMTDTLTAGKTYCVTYYANLINYVNYAVDELAAYFDNGSLQSISWSHEAPANAQIKSPSGVFYSDTLNWMKVQGTFTANGSESYITIGNFRYTAATTYTSLDGQSAGIASYFIDDISVIDVATPAYAGPDKYIITGDSAYIGRPSEIGLDDDCFWYKLPGMVPIDTVAGTWVKPANTTTYVVKQDICGYIEYDTVIVYKSAIGINELKIKIEELIINPNPADDLLNIELSNSKDVFEEVQILNSLGQVVYETELIYSDNKTTLYTNELLSGVYFLKFRGKDHSLTKRIVIFR